MRHIILLATLFLGAAQAQYINLLGPDLYPRHQKQWRVRGAGVLASRPATCTANLDVWICIGTGCTNGANIHYCRATDTWQAQSGAVGASTDLSDTANLARLDAANDFTNINAILRAGIGTTATQGLGLRNLTAAAAGAQQYSPFFELEGQGWKTDATAESQSVKWRWQLVPVQGAAAPTARLDWDYKIGAGAYTNALSFLNGNVGIGTAGPGYKLEVVGTLYASGAITSASSVASGTTLQGGNGRGLIGAGTGNNARFSNGLGADIELFPDSASGLYVAQGGDVGIGTADLDGTPAIGRLVVKGSTNDGSTNAVVLRDSDEANVLAVDSNGVLDTYNSQSTVGIGQPYILGNVSATAQVAAITTANLVGTAAAGLYRVSGYTQTTTASTGACTSDVTIGWTYNSSAKTLEVVSNHNQAVDEGYSQIPVTTARVDASANLTYAVSLDAGGGDCSNATFDVYLVAERLQ